MNKIMNVRQQNLPKRKNHTTRGSNYLIQSFGFLCFFLLCKSHPLNVGIGVIYFNIIRSIRALCRRVKFIGYSVILRRWVYQNELVDQFVAMKTPQRSEQPGAAWSSTTTAALGLAWNFMVEPLSHEASWARRCYPM